MKRFSRGGRGAWAASAVAVLGGCTTLLGIDKDYHGVEGGSGGGTSSSGTGGATSSRGTGGAGTTGVGKLGEPCMDVQQLACAGNAQKLQLICGPGHIWQANGTCNGSMFCDTAMGVDQGTCKPVVAECAGKSAGDVFCTGVTRMACGPDLVTTEVVETCPYVCSAGVCVAEPSCGGCGPNGIESCCASSVVAGGTYNRGNDANYPAKVSSFRLDRFEITVGRFRQFMAGYPGNKPVAGAGAHPLIAGSGWQAGWDASLAADQAALKTAVKCGASFSTWTDTAGGNESKPMNCLDWYEAFAFCAWDGGRLATEAEWNYAAAGGNEQRNYPWGAAAPDNAHAVYDCTGDGSAPGSCAATDILNVGAKSTLGDGKWGQADLAGSVWEWNLDWYGDPYVTPCSDCAIMTQGTASFRVLRGGSSPNGASNLLSSLRNDLVPTFRNYDVGARCARTP